MLTEEQPALGGFSDFTLRSEHSWESGQEIDFLQQMRWLTFPPSPLYGVGNSRHFSKATGLQNWEKEEIIAWTFSVFTSCSLFVCQSVCLYCEHMHICRTLTGYPSLCLVSVKLLWDHPLKTLSVERSLKRKKNKTKPKCAEIQR